MKKLVLGLAAAVAMTAPAHAAWKNFVYKDYSFAVDFPAEPKMTKGTYQAVVAGKVPTVVIGAEEDNTTYRVVISDFRNRLEDTPGILIEAAFIAGTEGKVVADTVSRTDNGQKFAKYGRRVAVLTPDDFAALIPDGFVDVLRYSHTLEHLIDPVAVLRAR